MSKTAGIVSAVTCAVVIALVAMAYALFHGYFDQGNFQVLSAQRSSAGQLAMVVKRSDHEALNGDEIFVLLGDHVLSTVELKHAFHSPAVIFSTNRDCLSLGWKGSADLAISCEGNVIEKSEINRQLDNRDGVAFTYVNIANSK